MDLRGCDQCSDYFCLQMHCAVCQQGERPSINHHHRTGAKERRNSSKVFDIGDERALESACADAALEVGISAS
jgi:hypothetical protein